MLHRRMQEVKKIQKMCAIDPQLKVEIEAVFELISKQMEKK